MTKHKFHKPPYAFQDNVKIDRCNKKNMSGQSDDIRSVAVRNLYTLVKTLIESDEFYNAEKLRLIQIMLEENDIMKRHNKIWEDN